MDISKGPWKAFSRDGKPYREGFSKLGFTIKAADGKSVVACSSSVTRTTDEMMTNAFAIEQIPQMVKLLKGLSEQRGIGTDDLRIINEILLSIYGG